MYTYKSLLCILSIFIITSKTNAQESVKIDSTYLNGHYIQRLDFFKKMPNLKNEIVFLGNSITEGGKWQELINRKKIVNRGISGDVTYGVIARLNEVLASRPRKIFLLAGINDMKRGIPTHVIIENFNRIIRVVKTQSPTTILIIQGLLPVNEKMLPPTYVKLTNEKINQLNHRLEEICEINKVIYVDLHSAFADENGHLSKALSIDGLHLRQATYILWVNYLKQVKLI